jgi:hypothetical protein
MRAATALEPSQHIPNVLVGLLRILLKTGDRRHNPTIGTVTALRRFLLDKGCLHRMRLTLNGKPIEGPNLSSCLQGRDRERTRADRRPGDDDSAYTALGKATAKFRPFQAEFAA